MKVVYFVICLVMLTINADAVSFPLSVHSSGRYLVDSVGTPFRVQSDAAWLMTTRATSSEVDTYLADRKSRGFNTIVLMGAVNSGYSPGTNNNGNEPYNRNGDLPWTTKTGGGTYNNPSAQVPDLSTPNATYWAWVDTVISKANAQGMAVLFFPLYLGWGGQNYGWWSTLVDSGNSQAKVYSFGQWLGTRYSAYSNIIWMAGGDFGPTHGSPWTTEGETRDHKIFEGIKASGATQILGAQWDNPDTLATDTVSFAAIIDLNTFYGYGPSYNGVVGQTSDRAWQVSPSKPVLAFEMGYEDDSLSGNTSVPNTRKDTRYYQWSSILAGSTAGNCFGTYGVWNWLTGTYIWSSRINSSGSNDASYLNTLFATVMWYNHKPSGTGTGYLGRSLIVSGQGTDLTYIYASSDSNGSGTSILAYVPPTGTSAKTFSVDLRGMGSTTRARWFNPTSGAYTTIGNFANTLSAQSFTTPGNNGSGTNDWVLVVDAVGNVNVSTITNSFSLSQLDVSYTSGSSVMLISSQRN